jgi:uncharacterized repeat protein (TIGR02543 family)
VKKRSAFVRIAALIVAIVLMFSMFPINVLAENKDTEDDDVTYGDSDFYNHGTLLWSMRNQLVADNITGAILRTHDTSVHSWITPGGNFGIENPALNPPRPDPRPINLRPPRVTATVLPNNSIRIDNRGNLHNQAWDRGLVTLADDGLSINFGALWNDNWDNHEELIVTVTGRLDGTPTPPRFEPRLGRTVGTSLLMIGGLYMWTPQRLEPGWPCWWPHGTWVGRQYPFLTETNQRMSHSVIFKRTNPETWFHHYYSGACICGTPTPGVVHPYGPGGYIQLSPATLRRDGLRITVGLGEDGSKNPNGYTLYNDCATCSHPRAIYSPTATQAVMADYQLPFIIENITVHGRNTWNSNVLNTGLGGSVNPNRAQTGQIINIFAGMRPGYTFNGWTASSPVIFSNANDRLTTFIMPDDNVTITASWIPFTTPNIGDVNGDGRIDQADVTLLIRFLLASDRSAFVAANPGFIYNNADVDNNGEINTADLTLLKFLAEANN